MRINGIDIVVIVLLTVLFNGGLMFAAALATRAYRRRQAAAFAARIVYMTSEHIREALLDVQKAVSAASLQDLRNRIDHTIDLQKESAQTTAMAVAEQVENGTLPPPLTPPDEEKK